MTHCSTRLKGDYKVNLALDNRLERESNYTRKKSITVEAEAIYNRALNYNMVQGEIPGTTPENESRPNPVLSEEFNLTLSAPEPLDPPAKFISEVKAEVKSQVLSAANQSILEHVQTLIKQGHFLELCKLEETEATWNSYIYNLPRGTMKFILNASIDTLPTKANLKQWGKLTNDKCFCGQRQTLNHVLNCCKTSLDQGRLTYRHDNILLYIAKCLDRTKFRCYIDIEGYQTPSHGTLPPSVVVTTLKPDMVIIDQKNKTIHIFELTVPKETRILTSNKLKLEKYQHFSSDITSYKVMVIPFEVGSHTGLVTRENRKSLTNIHKFCTKDVKLKNFIRNISSICVLGSFHIFTGRNEQEWLKGDPIQAPFANQ